MVGGGRGIVLAGPIVDALDYHWLFWQRFLGMHLAGMRAAHSFGPSGL